MNPSSPRCQTSYLDWACSSASIDINQSITNHFILPESNHQKTSNIPPHPYLVTTKDSYVTMCGQIISSCGLIHTTANCMARGHKYLGLAFRDNCPKLNEVYLYEEYLL